MEHRPFEIEVGSNRYQLELGRCAVVLFRQKQECSYVTIMHGEDTVRAYDNLTMCQYLAGYLIQFTEEDHIVRPTTVFEDKTFREEYGWNPATIEREEPDEHIETEYLNVVSQSLETEWEGMGD